MFYLHFRFAKICHHNLRQSCRWGKCGVYDAVDINGQTANNSRVTRTMLLYGLLLAAIGIYSLFSPLNSNEKMPVINIMSSRSLFFEQNVFGIFMFFCFIYMLRYRAMVYQNTIFWVLFSSFYRTVWAMAFMGLFQLSN